MSAPHSTSEGESPVSRYSQDKSPEPTSPFDYAPEVDKSAQAPEINHSAFAGELQTIQYGDEIEAILARQCEELVIESNALVRQLKNRANDVHTLK